jgi:DinB superfamily
MIEPILLRPKSNEYAPYYEKYVSLVNENNIVSAMINQADELKQIFSQITDAQGLYAYAEGKWTIKEVLGHLIDGERVFAYRAYRISRNDKTQLASFEQDDYIANGYFNDTKIADLIEEFYLLRKANTIFLNNLTEEAWLYTGTASEATVSVRALAYIMVGHVRHHTNILKDRYLD